MRFNSVSAVHQCNNHRRLITITKNMSKGLCSNAAHYKSYMNDIIERKKNLQEECLRNSKFSVTLVLSDVSLKQYIRKINEN